MQTKLNATVDLWRKNTNVMLYPVQNDKGARMIVLKITENGHKYEIPLNSIVNIGVKKPDRAVTLTSCTFDGDSVTAPLSNQTLAAPGFAECEIQIICDDKKITTPKFQMFINEQCVPDETVISSDEFNALTDALAKSNNIPDGVTVENGELQLTANGVTVGDPAELPIPIQNGDYVRYSFTREYLEQFNSDTKNAFSYHINSSNYVIEFLVNLAYAAPETSEWIKILPVPEIPDIEIKSWNEHGIAEYQYTTEQIYRPFTGLYIDAGVIDGSGTENIQYVSMDMFEQIISGGYWYYANPQMIFADLDIHNEWWSNDPPNTAMYKQPYNGIGIAFNFSMCETQEQFNEMVTMINSLVKGFVICWQKPPKTVEYKMEASQ